MDGSHSMDGAEVGKKSTISTDTGGPSWKSNSRPGKVQIFGVPTFANVASLVIFVRHLGIGDLVHQMPGDVPEMRDGDVCLTGADAILHHLVSAYGQACIPQDVQQRRLVDEAFEYFNTSVSEHVSKVLDVALGFSQWRPNINERFAAGKVCMQCLEDFARRFLTGKFVGGDRLSIADFKVIPVFAGLTHPVLRREFGIKVPPRIITYYKDFAASCLAVRVLIEERGLAMKEMLDLEVGLKICLSQFHDASFVRAQASSRARAMPPLGYQDADKLDDIFEDLPLAETQDMPREEWRPNRQPGDQSSRTARSCFSRRRGGEPQGAVRSSAASTLWPCNQQ